jgi:hypothetical protein
LLARDPLIGNRRNPRGPGPTHGIRAAMAGATGTVAGRRTAWAIPFH